MHNLYLQHKERKLVHVINTLNKENKSSFLNNYLNL